VCLVRGRRRLTPGEDLAGDQTRLCEDARELHLYLTGALPAQL
jgi:hypothetical protein